MEKETVVNDASDAKKIITIKCNLTHSSNRATIVLNNKN